MKRIFFIFCVFILTGVNMLSAQITTSALSGRVSDAQKNVLPGATIIAIHTPSGTRYGVTSNADGYYNIQGMRPGGPYSIEVSFIGYDKVSASDIKLPLGETYIFNPDLKESSVALEEVTVKAKGGFNTQRTGASSNITPRQLESMPTISRSVSDITRLVPQAASTNGGTSFAGANNRYNSFQIDGMVNNDVFGLAGNGMNGGQAGIQPISLDAIEQIQVVIAPYDVRQSGFTGGGINAITKSGDNQFRGSAYYYMNNQSLAGKTAGKDVTDRKKLDKQSDMLYGLTLGGPILKDKLFFFINGEITDKSYPLSYTINNGSNITEAEALQISDKLKSISGGYDGGGFNSKDVTTKSYKTMERLDWNISEKHQLSAKHTFLKGKQLNLSNSANGLRFNDNGYYMNNQTNTYSLELNSQFGSNKNNQFRAGYTRVRDFRDYGSTPFPYVKIKLDNLRTVELGTERYSTANTLNQDIYTLTDNFNWNIGKHQLTFGTHNELFKLSNLFIRENFGSYVYSTLDDFMSIGSAAEVKPEEFNYSFSNEEITGSKRWAPTFKTMQIGLYAQDRWMISNRFDLTYGLRIDVPIYMDKPGNNEKFNTSEIAGKWDVSTDKLPKSTPLFSPRLGFRWNVTNDATFLVRGGVGIFTGRIPFVWISNSFSNTGVEYVRTRYIKKTGFPQDFKFESDINNQPAGSSMTSEVDVVSKKFKYPQSFRANLAVEKMLPYGIHATLEGIYTKKMNDILYRNINIEENGTFINNFDDQRPRYKTLSQDYTSVIMLDNTSKGYSYNITAMLDKNFNSGLSLMAAYTYGTSKGRNDGTSSQAYSNWSYNENYAGSNNPELSYTDFDMRHRVIGSATYSVKYAKHFGTTVSLFYSGNSGSRYTVCYNGDLNGDGVYGNDVLFVPTDAQIDQMQFAGTTANQQRADLKAFLGSKDSGMSNMRGKYAKRNGLVTPFENHFDFRLLQDFYVNVGNRKHTLQVNFDILNIGNLFSKEWGIYNSPSYSYTPIKVESIGADGTPTFSFAKPKSNKLYSISDYNSRWRAQIGVRYIF